MYSGRKMFAPSAAIVTPERILRWHRELEAATGTMQALEIRRTAVQSVQGDVRLDREDESLRLLAFFPDSKDRLKPMIEEGTVNCTTSNIPAGARPSAAAIRLSTTSGPSSPGLKRLGGRRCPPARKPAVGEPLWSSGNYQYGQDAVVIQTLREKSLRE
jgi:hypothetical protein